MNTNKYVIFFLTTCFFAFNTYSQSKYEFFGILKLNGDSKKMITYRINFEEKNGKINGFSITDLEGEHETKNIIKGTYDSKSKIFSFAESEILYTKSAYFQNVFCFINFTGKIKLINKNSKLDGDFKGMFKNKESCIDGTLSLIGSEKIYDKLNKISKKIEKKKNIDSETKEKINPIKLIDELRINKLSKDQNLNIFCNSKIVTIEIYDESLEDNDIINLTCNDEVYLSNYKVLKKKKRFYIELKGEQTYIVYEAVSEGLIPTNTAKVIVYDNDRPFELTTKLLKGEKASITLIKKDAKK